MIENSRLRVYKGGAPVAGRYVLYWMQQAQRTRCNHALEWASEAALACGLPLRVAFALTDDFPGANVRHYAFMLEGLRDVADALHERGIAFTVQRGNPPDVIAELAGQAALLVGDVGYLRLQRQWREEVATRVRCPFTAVETDVVVPVALVSDKEEYAARTIRPKINRLRERFLMPLAASPADTRSRPAVRAAKAAIPALDALRLDRSVAPSPTFRGGQEAAAATLARFLRDKLPAYHTARNDPANGICSDMSPFLHFGQISPLDIALQVQASDAPAEAVEAYLEELIVRRELSMNFVHYQPAYDSYDALPDWARKTLDRHRHDPREVCYNREQFERAATHDRYWNAAQQEMVVTGKMHNYMRMYWGKKVIEWSPSPEVAFETLLYLNNTYELDGRDANGFTGVAWCFGKHDRPWTERPIFGTVRYMAASGLERKFNIEAYVRQVEGLG
jgi:deoxyribodipyrimidine photo-lyase